MMSMLKNLADWIMDKSPVKSHTQVFDGAYGSEQFRLFILTEDIDLDFFAIICGYIIILRTWNRVFRAHGVLNSP